MPIMWQGREEPESKITVVSVDMAEAERRTVLLSIPHFKRVIDLRTGFDYRPAYTRERTRELVREIQRSARLMQAWHAGWQCWVSIPGGLKRGTQRWVH